MKYSKDTSQVENYKLLRCNYQLANIDDINDQKTLDFLQDYTPEKCLAGNEALLICEADFE